jgi:hypothetical protein
MTILWHLIFGVPTHHAHSHLLICVFNWCTPRIGVGG